jgi:hypothetical protein
MYGGVPLAGLESAAGNKLEKVACKGEPLSTLVKMGGHSAQGVFSITRCAAPVTRCPSACHSLLRLLLAPSCTLMYCSFFLLVVEREAGRRIASVFVPSPQASPIIPEMAPCNVSADSPTAACITYELPGSLLKLICDVNGVCN